MIDLNNVSLNRSQRSLIKKCNLGIKKGGFYALTGENGSGKSTLLEAIIGDFPIASGNIVRRFKQGECAYLPQKNLLDTQFPMSVEHAVMAGLWLKFGAFKKIKNSHFQQVDAALQEVGIAHLRHSSINQLSGGELQRMLFARMLVQEAPLLLLDEPLAAIDQNAQSMLLETLKAKHKQGTTVIITLHDAGLVKQYATDQLHIREQKIHSCNATFEHSFLCCTLPLNKVAV